MYMIGGRVGFYNGNMKHIHEDIKILKPTVMPAVPRLLNRIYENEMANIRPSLIKRLLFNIAMNSKHSKLKRWVVCNGQPESEAKQLHFSPFTQNIINNTTHDILKFVVEA